MSPPSHLLLGQSQRILNILKEKRIPTLLIKYSLCHPRARRWAGYSPFARSLYPFSIFTVSRKSDPDGWHHLAPFPVTFCWFRPMGGTSRRVEGRSREVGHLFPFQFMCLHVPCLGLSFREGPLPSVTAASARRSCYREIILTLVQDARRTSFKTVAIGERS